MAERGERHPLGLYLGLGFFQGLVLLSVTESWASAGDGRALLAGLLTFVLVGTLQVQLLGGQWREARRGRLVLGCALLLAVLLAWFVWQSRGQESLRWSDAPGSTLLFGELVLFYILTPFIQAWDSRSGGRFDYTVLYRHAWNNGLILLLAALLVGLFWLLIALWAGLFSVLGIKLFAALFFNRVFVWLSCASVFAVGVRIGLQRDSVIEALRGLLLAICRALLPLTVLIVLLFVVCLPFTGLEPLWATKRATAILLALVFAHLCLLNGVFQDGRQACGYARPLRLMADASLLVLPLLAALAGYALWLRVQQYGLTPSRVLVGLLVVMALLYALAAAGAVLRRAEVWLDGLRRSNPPIALTFAVLLVLLQTPWFSPQELSAASQFRRLLSGQVAPGQFDAGLLRFQLGEPGRRYLARLEQLLEQPGALPAEQAAPLRADLQRLQQSRQYGEWRRNRHEEEALPPLQLQWLGTEPADVDGLFARLESSGCRRTVCNLLPVDLDGDGAQEVLVIRSGQGSALPLPIFARDDKAGGWRGVGVMAVPGGLRLSGAELVERMRRGAVRPVASRYQALEVGEVRLEPRLN
ncbi:DUF4153 domain-containing protein [Pseudomonas sp. MAP12]|uniref:DUF4153 domain-containing protein n=1 Tax=Geopseudomonas aromaticivorans TaxID=2849492 RepID=A0ABS6MZA2_9GAMM|nr:DUF4153 domain-containing protein [Pseudomonas aromaticivorans]MBV2134138.1 DUF4153 domain-containing protein [Pseudomonas aromaticivorans]